MSNINLVENEVIEFKETVGELKEAIISIVAILNKHQRGRLYFGIRDNGEIIGQEVSDTIVQMIYKTIERNIEPKIDINVNKIRYEDKEWIQVDFSGKCYLYNAYYRVYIREGIKDVQLSARDVALRFVNINVNRAKWENKRSDYNLDDINEVLLKNRIERANSLNRINFNYTDKLQALTKLSLVNRCGELLNAGYVLFSEYTHLELVINTYDKYNGLLNRKQLFGNIFDLIESAEDCIYNNLCFNKEKYTVLNIPKEVIHEVLVNSFAHRDFNNPKENRILIYSDKIEMYNPGPFPISYHPEDFIDGLGSFIMNPMVSNVLYLTGEMQKCGSGLKRITDICLKENIDVKVETKENGTKVTLKVKEKTKEEVIEEHWEAPIIKRNINKTTNSDEPIIKRNISKVEHSDGIIIKRDRKKIIEKEKDIKEKVEDVKEDKSESIIKQENKTIDKKERKKQICKEAIMNEDVRSKIIEYCSVERTAKEIAEYLGYKSVDRFKKSYLNPLIEEGKIVMTIKNSPTNRHQKYIRK